MNSSTSELARNESQRELISDYYVDQNKRLHEQRPDYGSRGHRHAQQIRELAQAMQTRDVLDYGCGKATLADALHDLEVKNYDPAFPEWSAVPEPADLVVCGDVLEHIEPECLDAVLDDLQRVSKKMLYAVVATRPAAKTLPDGRNTHLIQEKMEWWLPKFWDRFTIGTVQNLGGEFLILCGPK